MSDLTTRLARLSPEKRAILARRLQDDPAAPPPGVEPLAVVGMACRFPGAPSLEAFWQVIAGGVDAITEIPADRWNKDDYFDPDPAAAGKTTTRWGGFIEGVDHFDAGFFGISPREAVQMDPQQRLLLEVAWHALEHAGQAPDRLRGSRTGVFVGAHSQSSDYAQKQNEQPESMDVFTATGGAHNLLSGRLSYVLDLHGPSLVVDTACSSSLVALHLASQSLRTGECSMAIVGGVNLILSPHFTIAASRMQMLAADGRCKPFDAAADGFTRAEGCGVIVVKTLADALAQGDRVLAVIRGSAVNQDGRTNGITAPNGIAQQSLIRQALRAAGVRPEQISYVETHGTGTPLGDPIEIEALDAVIAGARTVMLGAVKANIGHLEGAAGIAGVIKAVLCLTHRQIAPVVHFSRLNPHITVAPGQFVVPSALQAWDEPHRMVGVSAFGWSGTNAHVVLEEAPASADAGPADTRDQLFVVSASSAERLDAAAARWMDFSGAARPSAAPAAVAAASGKHRVHGPERAAMIARDLSSLRDRLADVRAGQMHPLAIRGRAAGARPGVVFVFPGQGSQWLGMGRELYAGEPVFRAAIDRCAEALAGEVRWSLVDELHAHADASRLGEIDVVQPMLFAMGVALAALWRAWGVVPDAVVGHSLGEVAAAHVAGILTMADAAAIICRRSALLKRISGRGAMAIVELGVAEAAAALRGYEEQLSIAVSNSHRSTVISGEPGALQQVLTRLQQQDVFCRPVKVDVASHSPQVEPLAAALFAALAHVQPRSATTPMISTVTGEAIDGSALGADYWVRNLRQPVLFGDAVQRAVARGLHGFVEVSPHPILTTAIDEGLQHATVDGFTVPSLRRDEGERQSLLLAAARLYVAGYPLQWETIAAAGAPSVPFADVPLTPFSRERYWLPEPIDTPRARAGHPFLGPAIDAGAGATAWMPIYGGSGTPAWSDWRLDERDAAAPGVLIDAALEAADAAGRMVITDLELVRPMVVDGASTITASMTPDAGRGFRFTVGRRLGAIRTTHVLATLRPADRAVAAGDASRLAASGATLTAADVYARLAASGRHTGTALRMIASLSVDDTHAVAALSAAASRNRWHFSGPVLQSCLDAAAVAAGTWFAHEDGELWDAVRCGRILASGAPAPGSVIVITRKALQEDRTTLLVDLRVVAVDGQTQLAIDDLTLRRCPADARALVTQVPDDWCFALDWTPVERSLSRRDAGGRWILLADDGGVAESTRRQLHASGGEAICISRDHGRELAPLLADALRQPVRGIVNLWSLDLPPVDAADSDRFERELLTATGSVVLTVQAIAAATTVATPQLWIVTRGAQPIGGRLDGAGPAQSVMWGLGRVVGEEHPECWSGLIDLDPQLDADRSARDLLASLLDEHAERQVGYRGGVRHAARFVAQRPEVSPLSPLRPDASYLIVGGLSGVGLAVAQWMVREGARSLILAARTALPPRQEWSGLDPATPEGSRVRAVQALEALGASVDAPAFDVADEAAVQAYFKRHRRSGRPPLGGIVQAAVVVEDDVLRTIAPASFAAVLRPKVAGTLVLHRLAQDGAVDFFVMFSSLGAMLGQTGQASYAAANAFLDGMAHYRQGLGQPGTSINWCGWREAGLGAAAAGARRTIAVLENEGIGSCTTAQGVDLFARLLQERSAQTIVMPLNRPRFRQSHWAAADPALFSAILPPDAVPAAQAPESLPDQLRAADPLQRRRLFEEFLNEQLASVLRLPPSRIERTAPLGSLGLESLMALEFRNRLQVQLGLKLSATLVWSHPTVSALAAHLAERLGMPLTTAMRSAAGDESTVTAVASPPAAPDFRAALDGMSDDDALRALKGGR